MKTQTNRTTKARSGFTLLELMIVIVIIGVLVALFFPAIRGIFQRGEQAKVAAELTQLDQSLQAFHTRFQEYPPSSLIIPIVGGTWSSQDRGKVRGLWPEFNFATNGGLQNDGMAGRPGEIKLNGAECLVFFLGGLQNRDTSAPVIAGFSKNPKTPWTISENSDGPFMEFDLGRVSDMDGDLIFEYLDPIAGQTAPYMFISAGGKTMNKDNDNYLSSLAPQSDPLVASDDDYDVFTDATLNMSSCYLQPDDNNTGSDAANNQPYRKDSFQLISPGEDGEYGTGGIWQSGGTVTAGRENEIDNVTNFSSGTLGE